ncbi:MAG: hypothetical protein E7466_00380 [Ruminococcaceae bacterium]|nr:hypothetical protein [Oscillospiraceae bacterium]
MKQYLLSVLSAAIISAVVLKLMGDKGSRGAVGKLVVGLFLTFTVISPIRAVSIDDWTNLPDSYTVAAQEAVAAGEAQTKSALQQSIKQSCEAYILDKARGLDVALEVEVTVSDDPIPIPVSVRLRGRVSPNAKTKLSDLIEKDLGVSKEEQSWI